MDPGFGQRTILSHGQSRNEEASGGQVGGQTYLVPEAQALTPPDVLLFSDVTEAVDTQSTTRRVTDPQGRVCRIDIHSLF